MRFCSEYHIIRNRTVLGQTHFLLAVHNSVVYIGGMSGFLRHHWKQ